MMLYEIVTHEANERLNEALKQFEELVKIHNRDAMRLTREELREDMCREMELQESYHWNMEHASYLIKLLDMCEENGTEPLRDIDGDKAMVVADS